MRWNQVRSVLIRFMFGLETYQIIRVFTRLLLVFQVCSCARVKNKHVSQRDSDYRQYDYHRTSSTITAIIAKKQLNMCFHHGTSTSWFKLNDTNYVSHAIHLQDLLEWHVRLS